MRDYRRPQGSLDIMTMRVELTSAGFSDKIGDLMKLKKESLKRIKSLAEHSSRGRSDRAQDHPAQAWARLTNRCR